MPTDPVLGYLNYRVVNRLSGVEVIRNLPHLHQSWWKVPAMQQGVPGAAAIGQFRLPLFPPQTEEYRAYKALYDSLDYGLRVEGYPGPVAAGAPRYAGIITGIKKSLNAYELTGYSDVWAAHMTKLYPGELGVFGIGGGLSIFDSGARYSKLNTQQLGEDFSAYNAANYTAVGTWTATTDQGYNVVTCSAGTNSTLTRNSLNLNNRGLYEVSGRILANGTDTTNAGMAGVGGNGGDNIARLVMRYSGAAATQYNVDVQICSGNGTAVLGTATNVLINQPASFNFTIQLVVAASPVSAGSTTLKAVLNGKDSGLSVGGSNSGTNPPALYFNAPATSTAQAWFASWFAKDRTTDFFTNGTLALPAIKPASYTAMGSVSLLDIWTLLATTDGGYWRWNPAVQSGSVAGTLDYGSAPGVDRSTFIRFVEGDNLIDASIEPNAEFFATTVTAPSAQLNDAGGVTWRNFSAGATYGVIEDVVPIVTATDYLALRKHAQSILANKTNLNNAKVVTVLRDPRTVDVWRELDYITVHSPTLGLNNVKALVMAYDFTEGQATQTLWLDQLAVGAYELAAARMRVAHVNVASAFASR